MHSPLFLVVTLTLALTVAANPLAIRSSLMTLSMAKVINVTGSGTIPQRDRARARSMKQIGAPKANGLGFDAGVNIRATNEGVFYAVDVSITLSIAIQRALIWLCVGPQWQSHYYM